MQGFDEARLLVAVEMVPGEAIPKFCSRSVRERRLGAHAFGAHAYCLDSWLISLQGRFSPLPLCPLLLSVPLSAWSMVFSSTSSSTIVL